MWAFVSWTNPLHGLSAEAMVTELVSFYGWDILYAALGLNCFNMNPSIPTFCKIFTQDGVGPA